MGDAEERFEHFMDEQFKPLVDAFRDHLRADERQFQLMTEAVNRISTTLEVQVAVAHALSASADKLFNGRWTKIAAAVVGIGSLAGVGALLVSVVSLMRHIN